jgi:hypothetical protein
MKPIFRIAFVALSVCATGRAIAQEVVGTSVVDGSTVELLNDQTWRYRDNEDAVDDCENLSLGVQFCGQSKGWVPMPKPNAMINAAYRFDSLHYGQIIIEALGTDQGVDLKFMREAVLQLAASATGVSVEQIPVPDTYTSTVSGLSGETIVYQVNVNGVDSVFVNTIVLGPNRVIQMMSYTLTDTFTEEQRIRHADFLSAIKIEDQ